jgi:hypothetical protein
MMSPRPPAPILVAMVALAMISIMAVLTPVIISGMASGNLTFQSICSVCHAHAPSRFDDADRYFLEAGDGVHEDWRYRQQRQGYQGRPDAGSHDRYQQNEHSKAGYHPAVAWKKALDIALVRGACFWCRHSRRVSPRLRPRSATMMDISTCCWTQSQSSSELVWKYNDDLL